MKVVVRALVVLLIFAVSGCVQKLAENRPTFSLDPDGNNGRIIVSHHYLVKNDGGEKAMAGLLILGALAGAPPPRDPAFVAKLYDITDEEPKYIGKVEYPIKYSESGWLESLLPAGKRYLMLDRSGTYEPEFLEVNIKAGETTHLAIAQRGVLRYASIDEIDIKKEDYLFCKGLQEIDDRTDEEKQKNPDYFKAHMNTYMKAQGISLQARAFRNYCKRLGSMAHVDVVTQADLEQFQKEKNDVLNYKTKYFAKWQAHPEDHVQPYDIRSGDLKERKLCSNEVRVCSDGTEVMRVEPTCSFEPCPQ